MRIAVALLLSALAAPVVGLGAQAPPAPPEPQQVEPMRCWWRTSTGAIRVGESFTVSLTCAVIETDSVQVVPDESRLGVASVQLAPFELLGGEHPPDSRSGPRRFLQYHYTVRLIDRDAIGHDVALPMLTLSYRVHSTVGADARLEGRDLPYVLPALPIRVLSLVPTDAGDIRDSSMASLGAVDALRFQSSLYRLASFALLALTLVAVAWALAPMAVKAAAGDAATAAHVSEAAILNAAAAELSEAGREGWGDAAMGRALRALRVVSAIAAGRAVGQRPLEKGAVASEGRLVVAEGQLRPRRATVSSGMTAEDVQRAMAAPDVAASPTRTAELEGLQAGLAAFTDAAYAPAPPTDTSSLDEAVRHGVAMAGQLAKARRGWRPW